MGTPCRASGLHSAGILTIKCRGGCFYVSGHCAALRLAACDEYKAIFGCTGGYGGIHDFQLYFKLTSVVRDLKVGPAGWASAAELGPNLEIPNPTGRLR